MKPLVVCDAGGVLIRFPIEMVWNRLRQAGVMDPMSQWHAGPRAATWNGSWSEQQFWDWVKAQCGDSDLAGLRAQMLEGAGPLIEREQLELLAEHAQLAVLSNHRHEWLLPLLRPFEGLFSPVLISSQLGALKPDPDCFELASRQLNIQAGSQPVLFVDDQAQNLRSAAQAGWQTLLADPANPVWPQQALAWAQSQA